MKDKNYSINAETYRKAILFSVIIFTFIILARISLSIVTYTEINTGDTQVQSENNLNCYWNISETSEVNITWYKNYQHDRNLSLNCTAGVECYTSIGSGTVLSSDIRKGEYWTCGIMYWNGTSNFTVLITDTAPTLPRVYDENSTEIENSTIVMLPEDYSTILDANSTDIDPADSISYELNDTTFCNISSATGIITCTPTLESHIGFRKIQVRAVTEQRISIFTMSMNVTMTNDAPTFSPALTTVNFTNGGIFNYRIAGIDAENNTPLNLRILNITRGVIESDLNLTVSVINNNTFYIMLGNNRSATYWEAFYSYNVTVSLNDTDNITNQSKTTNVTFALIGITSNNLPNISTVVYNSNNLTQGGRLEVYINATDENNDTLTFATGGTLYPINYSSSTFYALAENDSSWAYALINLTALTNDHVINRNITIYVFDTNENSTNITTLWINNTNDAPILHEISNNTNNTYSNYNISDMIAYTGVPFIFQVNATDIDDLTYDHANTGIRNYSTNDTTRFNINSTTGRLDFTPSESGNFTFIVNVTDGGGMSDTIVASIEILNNNNPQFHIPIILECWEFDEVNNNISCGYNLSDYVNDTDNLTGNDYISDYWTNSTLFTVNNTTGRFNFTASQSMIGNHTIMFNATDSKGGMNSTNIMLVIYNTNNPPSIDNINIPLNKMIVGVPYQVIYTASDLDLALNDSYENLTFNISINGTNISAFDFDKIFGSETEALLNITPIIADYEGNYTINITVTDEYNNITSSFMSIYIYNVTLPPNITAITPFGTPHINYSVNTSWISTAEFYNMTTNISISENQTYTFNNTALADSSSYSNSLAYEWYYDNSTVATTQHYNKNFNFYTSGMHNLTLLVIDEYGSNSTFQWKLNITDINRPPTYTNGTLYDLTIEGSGFLENYLTWTRQGMVFIPVFYDIDDDEAGEGYSEYDTTTVVFSSTQCPHANLTFASHRLNIDAYSIGECYVIFTATDFLNSSMSVSSEMIMINITNITQNAEPEPEPINTETTGGGTNREPIPIPMPEEVEKPVPLQLITPKLVTVYKNATIKVPIIINNTWNDTLVGITLEGMTNASNVSIYLDKIYIPKLNKGESTEATLYIRNYKSEGHYEIQISANVTIPRYKDTATIYINSAEMRSEGEELENKIAFAQDLLSSNPECQELNELLGQAKIDLNNEDYASTARIVDNVINGCKYLVNNAKKNQELPERNFIKTFEWKKSYNDYMIIGFFAVLFMASLYYIMKKDNPEEEF